MRTAAIILLTSCFSSTLLAKEVVVYSARNEALIQPAFTAFEKKTGIKVKFTTDKEAPLLEKIKAEGNRTPADILLTVDAGNLWNAAEQGIFQPIDSAILKTNVPEHLRDKEGRWFGLSVRARTLVYNTTKVKPAELVSYADLADPRWKGHLCLRSAKKVYNQSLVAMMIAEKGEGETEKTVKGWVNNLATQVFNDDTDVIKAVNSGVCQVGIVNSYYFGRFIKSQPQAAVALFWPDRPHGGVHVNISGAGVLKHAKHPQEAQELLEFLSSDAAQSLLADSNMEYPVNPKVKPAELVQKWGTFDQNVINVTKAGELQKKAVQLMDRAKYQ